MTDTNNQEVDPGGSGTSITDLARKEFDRPEDSQWKYATPIFVKNLSLKKDEVSVGRGGSDPSYDGTGLQTAPNFATAVFGRWLAAKLRLSRPPPTKPPSTTAGAREQNHCCDHVFSNVSALLLPGEGTLVLGPSSSGKTTLLQTICDKLSGKKVETEGTILFGKNDPSTLNLTRIAAFVDQTDLTLTPILTVEETVRFARSCAEHDRDDLEDRIHAILELAGLDHVKTTVVGNADIRGVSGGQKRRVKLLEMAVGSEIQMMALDEITNGLDAVTALEICKVLKTALETSGITALTTLLQPSPEVFRTFHRLILLTQGGHVAYSGKTDGAIAHFESLGLVKPNEMSEAEFLLRCATSPRDFWDDEHPCIISTSAELVKAFPESEAGRVNIEEIEQVEKDTPSKDAPVGLDGFAQPMYKQIRLLMGRGWKLVARNPASLQRVVFAVIFGAFVATLFLNTGSDAKGSFIRAGYVLTLLFLVFINAVSAPLDDLYNDRLTFYTHRRASFYGTCAYYISQAMYSALVPLSEAFFLCLISFFGVGMNSRGGWGFMYFWAVFSLVSVCGSAVARVLAYSLPSNDIAQSLAPAVLLLFILSAGYSPQYLDIPVWLRWLSWISPCAYCYEGAIVNEMRNRNVGNEDGTLWAQQNLGIPRISYQSAPPGLSTEGQNMAFDAYMLIVLTLVFDTIGCCLLHHSQKWFGPTSKRYQVASGMSLSAQPWYRSTVDGENSKSAASLEEDKGNSEVLSPITKAPPAHLTAKNIVYEVDVPIEKNEETSTSSDELPEQSEGDGEHARQDDEALLDDKNRGILITARDYGQAGKGAAKERAIKRQLGEGALARSSLSSTSSASFRPSSSLTLTTPVPGRLRLLSGITASFEPGTMTALMGSSGAGKSTLLDVLAGYKTGGHITGDININGKPKTDETWRSIAGYCEQVDLHNPAITVLESIIFAARLRLRPFSLTDDVKMYYAKQILALLDLGEFSDMLVGDEAAGEGLPKHARKRLTVGVELAGNPSILFADEPTSGLDSLSASVVVSCLERAAKQQGLTIVCTVHQPSREVFAAFDFLLLLRKGGVCVYNGPISSLNEYMQSVPGGDKYALSPGTNPADHVLAVFGGQLGEQQDWGQLYAGSEMAKAAMSSFTSCACESCISAETSIDVTGLTFRSELWIVAQRQALSHWRTPTYMAVRFLWTVIANLLVAIIYFQTSKVTNIIGSIFFYVNIATVPLISAIVPLISERAVFYREVFSGTYRRKVYGIAVQIAEVPFNLGAAIVSFLIFYFMVGLNLEAGRVIYFLLMALAMYWMLPTFGQLFAFLSPNIGAAVGLGSLLLTLFTLAMGFLLPASEIPPWYIWIYWMNPLRYLQQGLAVNELGGNPVGDATLDALTWSYNDRWWYCYVAVLVFSVAAGAGILVSTRIRWLER